MKNPLQMAEYVISMTAELHHLGLRMIQDSLEAMDQMLKDSPIRLKHWIVESHTTKQLVTSLGTVTFRKTLFTNKETGTSEYLLDRILGLERNERLTQDAEARLLSEAVQTSYRRGGEEARLTSEVSKQTVKNKFHPLNFPLPEGKTEKKKVDYLYIDADEDHVSLQWHEKKGDMLELVRYQKREQPRAVGAEYDVLSGEVIQRSERNRHRELGKYTDRISHSISLQNKKIVYFNSHIWGL